MVKFVKNSKTDSLGDMNEEFDFPSKANKVKMCSEKDDE